MMEPCIPGRPDLDLHALVRTSDLDALAAIVANLTGEVVVLQERLAALEGDPAEGHQERIDAVVRRVFSPLTGQAD